MIQKIHKAKKSLGQNFLKSEPALRKIIESGEINSNDTILEIGPGRGALTKKLLATTCQVIAVEKDRELVELLKEKFKKEIEEKKLILVPEDILEFDINQYKLSAKSYKIIANIPYNITGAILKKFLTEQNQPKLMVLMVQNEVAKRIVARDGKESILSISVKAYGEPKLIMKVPARYFSPSPKVDSAIIAIKNISRQIFEKSVSRASIDSARHDSAESEEKFWEIVKTGFAHKRKRLGNNLKVLFSDKKDMLSKIENKRAEDLALSDWIELSK